MEGFIIWWAGTVGKLLSPKLSIFLVSLLPLIEERGGLLLAKMLGVPMWEAVFVFGGLLGEADIININNLDCSVLINRGGKVAPPIQALKN